MVKFFKKYHKWLGIVISIFILLFAASGIVLNHRNWFSPVDVSRSLLPSEYEYQNWNSAAVKSTVKIGGDSILIYGNIGVWLTDTHQSFFSDFNKGFPKGVDNHKVCKVFKSTNGKLFAGTLFGLFKYDEQTGGWTKILSPEHNPRVVDIAQREDTLFVLSRSFLYKTTDGESFIKTELPPGVDYDNKIGLFKTLWVIHSGEIYGAIGKLLVDIVGLIFVFLTITGIVYFLVPLLVKMKRGKIGHRVKRLKRVNNWSLKWHNKIGWMTIVFLIITTITGMFLRPPLLAIIGEMKVGKIPFTELDTPNPWFDKLRRIIVDEEQNTIYFATLDGIYYSDLNISGAELKKSDNQPPMSIMGVNAFRVIDNDNLLVGSFEGLFKWNHSTGFVYDAIKQQEFIPDTNKRIPLGEFLVTGYSGDFEQGDVYFDFDTGAGVIGNGSKFAAMPSQIKQQKMSLWNVALEVHTARMYKIIFGKFYILFIPLAGFIILFILISGLIVWYKNYWKKKKRMKYRKV